MRTMGKLGVLFVFVTAMAYAETWTGRLVDAACAVEADASACIPSSSTVAFALVTSDAKMYMFDTEGNKKAAEALKESENGAERAADPEAEDSDGGSNDVMATVKGTMEEGQIEVESIEVH